MGDARARAIFEADDSPLMAACLRANSAIMGMSQRFNAIKSFVIGMAPIAGVIAGVAKLNSVLESGKELHDTAEATGLATAEILKLRKEFKLAGKDASEIAPAIQKMQKNLVSGSADQALAKLGLNLQDIRKKSPAEQFETIGKAIAGMQDPAQKTATAMAVFGKTGASLLPIFANKNFGNVQLKTGDQLMAKDADLFADTKNKIETLKPSFESFFVGMADKIIPVFRPLLDQLSKIDFATMGQSFAEPISTVIQLFADGKLFEAAGLALKIGASEMVNMLWGGIQAFISMAEDGLVNGATLFLKVLEFCTKADFWKGLGLALLGFVGQFEAKMLNVVAVILERMSKIPGMGGENGVLGKAAAATRQTANEIDQNASAMADSGVNKLQPFINDLLKTGKERLQQEMKNAGDAFLSSTLIDTSGDSSKLSEMMAENDKRKAETSAKSLADAQGTQGTQAVEDYGKAPVVSALQRIGGAAGAGGGGVENILRESVTAQRGIKDEIKALHDTIKTNSRYALLK